jgi:hypothetical protein
MWVREMFVEALRELFDRPGQTAAEVQHLLMLYQARVERHNNAFVWDCEYCSDPEMTCGCGDHHRRSRRANSARDVAEQELANLCNALQLCCEKFVYAYFGPNTGVNTANVQQCALDAIDQLLRGHPDAPKACKRTEEAWVTLLDWQGVAKHPRDWLTAFDMKGFCGCPPEDLEQKQAFRDAIARLGSPAALARVRDYTKQWADKVMTAACTEARRVPFRGRVLAHRDQESYRPVIDTASGLFTGMTWNGSKQHPERVMRAMSSSIVSDYYVTVAHLLTGSVIPTHVFRWSR